MARKIFALLVLFVAAYLSAHFYIRWKNTKTDDVTKIGRLVECEPNDFREIEIRQKTGAVEAVLRFQRTDAPEAGLPSALAVERWSWKYSQPDQGEADPVKLRRIASVICELYDPARLRAGDFRPRENGSARLGESVTALMERGGKRERIHFRFGAVSSDHQNYVEFTPDGGSAQTIKISDQFLQAVSLEPFSYRNYRVMNAAADDVQQASLFIDGVERFSLERVGADWKVLKGGKEKGDGSEEAGKFINRVATLQALEIKNSAYTRENCETSSRKARLELRALTGPPEILRFQYSPGSDVHACSSARSSDFLVHKDFVKYLDLPLKRVLKN